MSTELDKQLRKLEALILSSQAELWRDYSSTLMIGLKALLDCRETPTWLKDTEGRVLYLNPAYCRVFKIADPTKYLGMRDDDEWGRGAGKAWRANDEIVMRKRKEMTFEEVTPRGHFITVRKWPVSVDGHLVGVAGEVLSGSHVTQ